MDLKQLLRICTVDEYLLYLSRMTYVTVLYVIVKRNLHVQEEWQQPKDYKCESVIMKGARFESCHQLQYA